METKGRGLELAIPENHIPENLLNKHSKRDIIVLTFSLKAGIFRNAKLLLAVNICLKRRPERFKKFYIQHFPEHGANILYFHHYVNSRPVVIVGVCINFHFSLRSLFQAML